ncbi:MULTISPECIES: hypothetical protein [unclassified Corynebacterium]|uniref:hypothetical protein n=1 Tax=unclassified Corynebacterium TaxID=2624378 RepID=UPI0029CAA699|nr:MULTISPECIES: hypothetical protein [unclassified Corynebacterium]WPF65938.1 hypothetical protein OLX12_10345 [Corynebacterium sp. 22KM0430]WPF68431.1 hypothetical protein OLW90_10340 [Corynebacterium sp. 21KM1197]
MSVTLIFALAAVALVIAAVLWWFDARGRASHSGEAGEAASAEQAAVQEEESVEGEQAEQSGQAGRRAPSRLAMPGQGRRERRSWAQEAGFSFTRTDDSLAEEWRRGAAASGATAHDVVTGVSEDHEFALADLDSTTVLAVRRGAASDVVVDFRRGISEDADSDLHECGEVEGFARFSTDTAAAERFSDERVSAALEVMPDFVHAVWCESDWVLAQLDRGTHGHDWEAIMAPMTWLADAAHALPPRAAAPLRVEEALPSRLMPAPAPEPEASEKAENAATSEAPEESKAEEQPKPTVIRPEEPVELPTRTQTQSRGVVEPRSLGGDAVPGIGDRAEEPSDYQGTRVLRSRDAGPSIFDDLAEQLGRDPLEHMRGLQAPKNKEK